MDNYTLYSTKTVFFYTTSNNFFAHPYLKYALSFAHIFLIGFLRPQKYII